MVVVPDRLAVVGFGLANQAVAAAATARGHTVVAVDDRPDPELRDRAEAIGIELVEAPGATALAEVLAGVDAVVPAPGLPDGHATFALAADLGIPIFTEFDLAQAWDDRPVVAITGTDGKTTVTTMVAAMLRAGGAVVVEAGNNDTPLVAAIADPAVERFVVEASSFRLGRTHDWAPQVALWLNLAPDHLDVHAAHEDYVAAKARIYWSQSPDDVAIGNLDDPVVAEHLRRARARQIGFSLDRADADYRVVDGWLHGPDGPLVAVTDLPRQLPHDIANALAAWAAASAAGAPNDAVAEVLRTFGPLPHRVAFVGTHDGVDYYDDSKATVPHATLAAVRGFDSVVLIAGGRNKGLDLGVLAEAADHLRAVVALGECRDEVAAVFAGLRPVERAPDMATAVRAAASLAQPGDAVLLSPACASFDLYPGYAARGDDFAAKVRDLTPQLEETS